MCNESWEIIKLFKWKQRNILAPNKSRQDVQAKVDIQLLDWVTSFIVISNSLDTVVTISGWNQVDYSHLKNFQKFILWNSCGIMSSSFHISLKWPPLDPPDVEIYKCWFDVVAVAFWDKTFVFWNITEQSKLTVFNSKNGPKMCWNTCFFRHRTQKKCEGFVCALAIYLYSVL